MRELTLLGRRRVLTMGDAQTNRWVHYRVAVVGCSRVGYAHLGQSGGNTVDVGSGDRVRRQHTGRCRDYGYLTDRRKRRGRGRYQRSY